MATTGPGLLHASHPAPALTVTALVTALVLAVGASVPVAAGVGVAVLAGQLSVGWSNDASDAEDDVAAQRLDKPVVRGLVDVRRLWVAAGAALVVTVPASLLAMGAVPGALHVLAVLAAWAYNLRLKDTPASPLPYAVAFGLLPVIVAALAEPPIEAAPWWGIVCACVGVAAHLANTAPDVDSDRRVGRGGLAVVLGSAASRALAVALVATAATVTLVSLAPAPSALVLWTLGCVASIAGLAAVSGGRWLFVGVMAAVVTNAVLVLVLA